MNRRSYLTGVVSLFGMAGVAGCSGEDGGDSGDGEGGDSESVSTDDVELVDHTLNRVEETPSAESVTVEGRAKNNSDQELSRVEIQVQFYTEAGDQADTSTGTIRDFGPGETGLFEVFYSGSADRPQITDYDIEVTSVWQ